MVVTRLWNGSAVSWIFVITLDRPICSAVILLLGFSALSAPKKKLWAESSLGRFIGSSLPCSPLLCWPPYTSCTLAFLVLPKWPRLWKLKHSTPLAGHSWPRWYWLLPHRWHRVGSLGLFGGVSLLLGLFGLALRLSTWVGGTGVSMALSCAWVASSVRDMSRSFSNVRSLPFAMHFLRTTSWSVSNTRVSRTISSCILSGYPQFWMRRVASVRKASNGQPFCLRLRR